MSVIERLRSIGIFNTYELLSRFGQKGKDVACSYSAGDGRGHPCGTTVMSPSHKTDPGSHWMHYGRKFFWGKRAISIPQAIEWATKKYGIKEWATDPTDKHSKVPAQVREAAIKEVSR